MRWRLLHAGCWGLVLLLLLAFTVLTDGKVAYQQWFYFPLAWVLSGWAVGTVLPGLLLWVGKLVGGSPVVALLWLLALGAVYGGLLLVPTTLVTLLLERLLGWPEHYALGALPQVWASQSGYALAGIPVVVVYQLVIYWLRAQMKHQVLAAKNEELLQQMQKAQLQSLQYQLGPHFLLNALNNIAMMVRTQKHDAAVEALAALGTLLRQSLTMEAGSLVPLKHELALLQQYLAIERRRLGQKIEIEVTSDPAVAEVLVPPLLLQPLVENACKHVMALPGGTAAVLVQASLKGQQLLVSIYNTGSALRGWAPNEATGIGMANTVERLRHAYQNGFSLTTTNLPEGLRIDMTLPASLATTQKTATL